MSLAILDGDKEVENVVDYLTYVGEQISFNIYSTIYERLFHKQTKVNDNIILKILKAEIIAHIF
jgi:hypothetical protein